MVQINNGVEWPDCGIQIQQEYISFFVEEN